MSNLYEGWKVYGPYTRKEDLYLHVILIKEGHRQTISYGRYLMEIKLGRHLANNEDVHHKDENPRNNVDSNLEIIKIAQHGLKHSNPPQKFICSWCGKEFYMEGGQLSDFKTSKKRGYKGSHCSRSCASKTARNTQLGR